MARYPGARRSKGVRQGQLLCGRGLGFTAFLSTGPYAKRSRRRAGADSTIHRPGVVWGRRGPRAGGGTATGVRAARTARKRRPDRAPHPTRMADGAQPTVPQPASGAR